MTDRIHIAGIYFFGYAGLNLDAVKISLPLKEGDVFGDYSEFPKVQSKIKGSVKDALGCASTDEALIIVGGKHIVFIGLPGSSNVPIAVRPEPLGKDTAVTDEARELYKKTMLANLERVTTPSDENDHIYFELRDTLKHFAEKSSSNLVATLSCCANAEDRAVAAYGLGLSARTREDIDALALACNDCNEAVRNNAIRAIGTLIDTAAELTKVIPHEPFVRLMNSPIWTDRNKAVYALEGLTKQPNAALFADLDRLARTSLLEMTIWPAMYASSAQLLLNRIADASKT
ncbi:MAG TPA: hypothetical protein V6D22_20995 [Candidatus Obscuribacterales bacterium]